MPVLSTCSLAEDVKTVVLQAGCAAVARGDHVVTAKDALVSYRQARRCH